MSEKGDGSKTQHKVGAIYCLFVIIIFIWCSSLFGKGYVLGYGFKSGEDVSDKGRNMLLKDAIEKHIAERIKEHKIIDASVYVVDLTDTTNTVGFHEEKKYFPASLLKVLILISYLKQREVDPNLNSMILKNDERMKIPNHQHFSHKKRIVANEFYRVDELVNRMIQYSDNNATGMLVKLLGADSIERTNAAFGFNEKLFTDYVILMSPKEYSVYFLALYNASYLNKSLSEEAIKILAGTDFTQGLVSGVPSTVIVAHKYGEREIGAIKELHDCGIIYLPQAPYFICVMTMGENMEDLSATIEGVSRMIYEEKVTNYNF